MRYDEYVYSSATTPHLYVCRYVRQLLELSVVSQEIGHASEDVDADYEGEELVVAFNPSYLIEGVDAVVGDEVVLETVDATKPATVRAPEHDEYRYLLMPVRVS